MGCLETARPGLNIGTKARRPLPAPPQPAYAGAQRPRPPVVGVRFRSYVDISRLLCRDGSCLVNSFSSGDPARGRGRDLKRVAGNTHEGLGVSLAVAPSHLAG